MVTIAFCIRLLMNVLTVLLAQILNSYCAQKDGAAFLRVLPNRLQFFEYEFISFNCEFGGSAEWRVMRTLREITPTNISHWVTSAGSGTINPAFLSDSGEYWCEDGDGRRSNVLNISVTNNSVILESPVQPVTEGAHVTLKCQKKKDSGHLIAEFYKDGHHIDTAYEGNMTFMISSVSTSDEGLYKCKISGGGESPESWLHVREPSKGDPHPRSYTLNFLGLLWIGVPFLLLSLLLFGVARYRKHKRAQDKTKRSTTRGDSLIGPQNATYAVVKKRRGEDGDNVVDQQDATYAVVKKPRNKKEPTVSKASAKQDLPEGRAVYSTLTFAAGNRNRDT